MKCRFRKLLAEIRSAKPLLNAAVLDDVRMAFTVNYCDRTILHSRPTSVLQTVDVQTCYSNDTVMQRYKTFVTDA